MFPVGDAREDWTILRALSAVLGKTLPFDNLGQLRAKHRRRVSDAGERGHRAKVAGALDVAPRVATHIGGDHLSDRRLLPHQPDRALVADDAALLGNCSIGLRARRDNERAPSLFPANAEARICPRRNEFRAAWRLSRGNGVHLAPASIGMISWFSALPYGWAYFIASILDDILLIALPVMLGVAMAIYCRSQDLGGDGAAPRAQRGRPVRAAAELRRRPESVFCRRRSSRRRPTARCS